jgi:DNA repair exonuclease SbcCD nuclease subunit
VIYPGSTSRTSFAEKDERKGYMIVEVEPADDGRGRLARCTWHDLPVRPMVQLDLDLDGNGDRDIAAWLRRRIDELDPDSIVRLRIRGDTPGEVPETLRAATLRAMAPPTMYSTRERPLRSVKNFITGTPLK